MPRSLKYLSLSLVLLFASAPSHSETLTVAAASLPESLQAGLSTNVALNVGRQMMSGLVARNNAGETIPDLAERWEFVSDTTWRFHLRHDVKFQDGSAFTADDVKYTLDHALDPKNAYGMIGRISAITNVAVVDP